MKTRSVRHLLSFVLSLSILLSSMVLTTSAFTVNQAELNGEEVLISSETLVGEEANCASEESEFFYQPSDKNYADLNNDAMMESSTEAAAITPFSRIERDVGITSIYAYPSVRCEETGQGYYHSGIYAYKIWTTAYSGSDLFISPTQVSNLNKRCLDYFVGKNDGMTYTLTGWTVVTNLEFNKRGQIRYAPTKNCMNGTNERSQSVNPWQSEQIILGYNFDPNLTTYAYAGFSGGFYPYSGVSEGISACIVINSNNMVNANIS